MSDEPPDQHPPSPPVGPPEGLAAAVPDDVPPAPIPLKGKKAEATPEKERPAEGEPFENVQGDTYTYQWPSLGVRAVMDGFIEEKDGLKCRLLVLAEPPNAPGLLHQSRINLEAQRTRSEVVNKLARRLTRIEWEALVEHMIFLALDRYREGEPVIKLVDVDYKVASPVLLTPFLSGDGGTILFGDGSAGKSTFALALAADLTYGGGRLGTSDGRQGCVLYLDWEDTERAHAERLWALTYGLNLPDVPEIYYRHMVASLPESIGSIRRIVADLKCDLVVIDSLVAACGGPIEDSRYVAHLFECCRSFGVPWLGITHITQEAARIQQATPGGYVAPFGCYSADTEVLTTAGWKRHDAVEPGDAIAVFDPAGEALCWSVPLQAHRYPYTGEMVRLRTRATDVLVTPNHRMVVQPAWTSPSTGEPPRHRRGWEFIEAQHLTEANWYSPLANPFWNPTEDVSTVIIAGITYPADHFLRFVGWWLAEGHLASGGQIGLTQADGDLAGRMRQTLVALGIDFWDGTRQWSQRETRTGVERPVAYLRTRGARSLWDWLAAACGIGASSKRIPPLVWGLSYRQQEIVLEALADGDGYRRNGNIQYSTTSRQLADDVQRLAVHLGRPATVVPLGRAKEHHANRYTVYVGLASRRRLIFRPSHRITREPYDGEVFCFTVETGAYLTRRNGKLAVQGNSRFVHNLARMTWMVERDQKPGQTEGMLMLTNWKNNHGPLFPRQVFKVGYEQTDGRLFQITLKKDRIDNSARFVKAGSVRTQILHHIKTGQWTAADLAETIGKSKKEIQTRVSEMKREGEVVETGDGIIHIHAKHHEPPPDDRPEPPAPRSALHRPVGMTAEAFYASPRDDAPPPAEPEPENEE